MASETTTALSVFIVEDYDKHKLKLFVYVYPLENISEKKPIENSSC
jgi:hypothetical protein